MAHDFFGNELSIGDDVVFLNYNVTSASLERGKITKVSEHTAEISGKRRAEYKIIKVNPVKPIVQDAVPVVRCGECRYYVAARSLSCLCCHPGGMKFTSDSDYCSRGERHSNQFENVKSKVLP